MLLSGVRVIDATNRFGWLAGRILADLGAEVVKVDAPGTDRTRPEWRAFNVNKRVVDLDLTRPADTGQFARLVATADICILTPRRDSEVPIDPDELRRRHPKLIVVVVTPFGSTGPRSNWKGSDIEAMAAGGAMALAGEPTGPPMRISEPQAYAWAGAQAAVGALVALCRRDATGRGERADVSAQASVVTALSHAPAFVDFGGLEPSRAGAFMTGRSIKGALYRVFWPCRDGYINFIFYGGNAGRRTNEQLVAWMRDRGAELGPLAAIDWNNWNPATADQAEVDAIEKPVMKFFAGISKREFLIEAHRREMLGYPVSTVVDIATDPQLQVRQFFAQADGSTETFCGAFLIIDGKRPSLRYAPGEPFMDEEASGCKRTDGTP